MQRLFFIYSNDFSAHADGERRGAGSNREGSVGKVLVRRIVRYLQIDTGPRRSPSACSEKVNLIIGKSDGHDGAVPQ